MSLLDEMKAAGIKPAGNQQNNYSSLPSNNTILEQMQAAGIKPERQLQSSQPPQPKQDGFFKGLIKSATKTVLEPTASVVNVSNAVDSLIKGGFSQDAVNQAGRDLRQTYNLPFFGETKPAFTGDESIGESFKKQAGYGAEIASYLVGGKGAGSLIKNSGESLVKQGVKQGAKFGALTGALSEGGKAAEQNKSGWDIAGNAIGGGVGGAFLGGALGGVSPFLGKLINKVKNPVAAQEQKALSETMDIIKPQLSAKEKQAALNAGRGQTTGLLKTTEIAPSNRDFEIADTVKNVVSKKKSNVANIDALHSEIKKDADTVIQGLKEHNSIYNKNQVQAALNKVKQSDESMMTFAGDDAAERAYDGAVGVFMKILDRKPKNLAGMLEARKEFDDLARRTISGVFEKENPRSIAVRDVRRMANEFISSKLPEGHPFKELLNRQSTMFDAIDNISKKTTGDVGKNMLQIFAKKHPTITKAAKIVGTLGAGGALGKKIFE